MNESAINNQNNKLHQSTITTNNQRSSRQQRQHPIKRIGIIIASSKVK